MNDELNSLKFELQLKNEELGKLRTENRDLVFKAERIVEKDGQIIKLEKKNEDLREEVNRLKQIERWENIEIFRNFYFEIF